MARTGLVPKAMLGKPADVMVALLTCVQLQHRTVGAEPQEDPHHRGQPRADGRADMGLAHREGWDTEWGEMSNEVAELASVWVRRTGATAPPFPGRLPLHATSGRSSPTGSTSGSRTGAPPNSGKRYMSGKWVLGTDGARSRTGQRRRSTAGHVSAATSGTPGRSTCSAPGSQSGPCKRVCAGGPSRPRCRPRRRR